MGVRYINRLSDIYCIGRGSQIDSLTTQAIKKRHKRADFVALGWWSVLGLNQ